MSKNGNGPKVSIAVLKTDLTWIKKEISEISTEVKSLHTKLETYDNRILTLENTEKSEERDFDKSMAKWSLIIMSISVILSVVISKLA